MTNRDKSIDIAKALGMIMVVFGHTQSSYIQIVYQFHLPLFFFLSGVVFNENKVENDIRNFIIGKLKGLYWPFVKFETLFLLLHNIASFIGIYSVMSNVTYYYSLQNTIKNFILILTMGYGEQLAGPLWFLISSFEIVLLFGTVLYFLNRICKSRTKKEVVIIIICLGSYFIGCYTDLPRMGSQSLIGMFFFGMGYFFRNYKKHIKFSLFRMILSGILIMICYRFNYVDISKLIITYKVLLIVSGLAGIYLILGIARWIAPKKVPLLEYCGKNTIYVLALHCISFKLVLAIECLIYRLDYSYLGAFPTYQVSELWCIPFMAAGVLIPLFFKLLMDVIELKVKGTKV